MDLERQQLAQAIRLGLIALPLTLDQWERLRPESRQDLIDHVVSVTEQAAFQAEMEREAEERATVLEVLKGGA